MGAKTGGGTRKQRKMELLSSDEDNDEPSLPNLLQQSHTMGSGLKRKMSTSPECDFSLFDEGPLESKENYDTTQLKPQRIPFDRSDRNSGVMVPSIAVTTPASHSTKKQNDPHEGRRISNFATAKVSSVDDSGFVSECTSASRRESKRVEVEHASDSEDQALLDLMLRRRRKSGINIDAQCIVPETPEEITTVKETPEDFDGLGFDTDFTINDVKDIQH